MQLRSLLSLPILALPLLANAEPAQWRFDTVHTQILFSVDHLGFSRAMGLIKLSQGQLRFDPDAWEQSQVDVVVDPASLLLGDTKWQDTVKSWQFLNVKRWPEARFRSRSIEQVDASQGVVHGELDLHGVKRPLSIPFRLNRIGNDPYTFKRSAGFSASVTLKRSDFGMDKLLSAVGDEVKLALEIEVVRERTARDSDPVTSEKGDTNDVEE